MARKSVKAVKLQTEPVPSWIALGVDISMSSIAIAAIGWDKTMRKMRGPSLHTVRWNHGEHYFERMEDASRARNLLDGAVSGLKFYVADPSDIFIAVEEPWPLGIVKRAQSAWIKQQAQMSGSFIGGLLRDGYRNVYEVNNQAWHGIVREHFKPDTIPQKEIKWKVKEWALEAFDVPELPDLIQSKHGKIPRPEKSRAKAQQPDDIYDALGIMSWMQNECEQQIGVG
jgi:hypothetical protein